MLWIGNGRSRETVRVFFEQLPEGVAGRIETVAIDMITAYELEIKANCPQAEIVYDLFHVVAKYGREVIDRVRVDQANQPLLCVYLLRDKLKRLWFYRKPAWAKKAWEQWIAQANDSGIAALKLFARRLQGTGTAS